MFALLSSLDVHERFDSWCQSRPKEVVYYTLALSKSMDNFATLNVALVAECGWFSSQIGFVAFLQQYFPGCLIELEYRNLAYRLVTNTPMTYPNIAFITQPWKTKVYWKRRLFRPTCVGFLQGLNRSYLGENIRI
jgi:hypothetical protein